MSIDNSFNYLDNSFNDSISSLNILFKDGNYSDISFSDFDDSLNILNSSFSNYNSYISNLEVSANEFINDISYDKEDSNDIKTLYDGHTEIKSLFSQYYNDNKELKNIITAHDTVVSRLDNTMKTDAYILLLIWAIIFYFVASALFLSVIEDKKEMNFFARTILVLFVVIVGWYSIKNNWNFIKNIV